MLLNKTFWPVEAEGVTYTLSGTKSGTTLEPFVATCTGGRLINATVPYGLYEHP